MYTALENNRQMAKFKLVTVGKNEKVVGPRSLIEYLLMEHQPSLISEPGALTTLRWARGSRSAMRNSKSSWMPLLINK
ncbi:hypothetical protein XK27_00950 [Streptococcus suis]|nr:hypothetical protein XK27_00950 [Streptococcus suis]